MLSKIICGHCHKKTWSEYDYVKKGYKCRDCGNFTTLTPTTMSCRECGHTYQSYVIYDPMTCPKCGYNTVYYKKTENNKELISE